jgi:hypothetical protein
VDVVVWCGGPVRKAGRDFWTTKSARHLSDHNTKSMIVWHAQYKPGGI